MLVRAMADSRPLFYPLKIRSILGLNRLRPFALPVRLYYEPVHFPHLDLADSAADLTVCFAVFHHLTREQRDASVQELIRITKPGGWIVASAWHLSIDDYEPIQHGDAGDIWVPWQAEGAEAKRYVHIYSLEEWKRLWQRPHLLIQPDQIGYFGKSDWTQDIKEARNLLVIAKKQ